MAWTMPAMNTGSKRELAVRTGTDTQVVAEPPIIKIMMTLSAWPCEGRDLVVLESCRLRTFLHGAPDIP